MNIDLIIKTCKNKKCQDCKFKVIEGCYFRIFSPDLWNKQQINKILNEKKEKKEN